MNSLPLLLLVCGLSAPISCGTVRTPERDEDGSTPPTTVATDTPVPAHPVSGRERIEIEIAGERFLMEISDDDEERILGLGGRPRLGRDEGMIFVYPRPRVLGFWMKDCLIDLEIVYLDRGGRIASIHRMKREPPRTDAESMTDYEDRLPRYPSGRVVQYALEFAPGTLERLHLKKGAKIVLPGKALLKNAR